MLLIKNGLVHDAINREPYIADIFVKNGKIALIKKKTAIWKKLIYIYSMKLTLFTY